MPDDPLDSPPELRCPQCNAVFPDCPHMSKATPADFVAVLRASFVGAAHEESCAQAVFGGNCDCPIGQVLESIDAMGPQMVSVIDGIQRHMHEGINHSLGCALDLIIEDMEKRAGMLLRVVERRQLSPLHHEVYELFFDFMCQEVAYLREVRTLFTSPKEPPDDTSGTP